MSSSYSSTDRMTGSEPVDGGSIPLGSTKVFWCCGFTKYFLTYQGECFLTIVRFFYLDKLPGYSQ